MISPARTRLNASMIAKAQEIFERNLLYSIVMNS